MALKAKKPEVVKTEKPKVIIYGAPGVGKTWTALDFPNAYFIDTEGGATQPHYRTKMQKAGVMYYGKEEGSQDFTSVIAEIKSLATEKHEFKTLVIDSFSKLYNLARARAELNGGSDFGRDKKEANKPSKQLMLWLERLDMNVILICHTMPKWERTDGNLVQTGYTFDGYDKLEYDLSLSLEITHEAKTDKRLATVRKTRIEGFKYGESFPWNFEEFAKRAGEDTIKRVSAPVSMASEVQVKRMKELLETLKVDEGWQAKTFEKQNVESWDEVTSEYISKCIKMLEDKMVTLKVEEVK